MSDNGGSESEKEQSKPPQEILRVDLIDNKLCPKINSNFLPMLCYSLKLLEVEIDKMIIDTKIRAMQENKIVPAKHGIIDFLRKRR